MPYPAPVATVLEAFKQNSPYRGISPRREKLLRLRQWARGDGEQYEDLKPWDPDIGQDGNKIPARERQPLVQLDIAGQKTRRLVGLLIGEGHLPSVEYEGGGTDELKDAIDNTLRLWDSLESPTRDLTFGAFALAFHRPDPQRPGELTPVPLEIEWAEPIFVSQAQGSRARQIAAELAEVEGMPALPSDDEGPFLRVPEGAPWDDVAFVRYEWETDEELAETPGGATTRDQKVWRRRDYTADGIVEYEPKVVRGDEQINEEWVPLPFEPMSWPDVPVVWRTSMGARPGDTEGRPLLTEAVLTQCKQADYTASLASEGADYNCAPTLALIDLRDRRQQVLEERGPAGVSRALPTDAKAVLEFASRHDGNGGEAKLLETSGAATGAAHEHIKRVRDWADRATGIVDHDPERAAGALSGVAMRRLVQPTVDQTRAYQGRLGPAIRLYIDKVGRALAADGVISEARVATLTWPDPVEKTPQDVDDAAEAWGKARNLVGIAQEDAVRGFAEDIGHPDPDGMVQRAAEERDEMLADLQAANDAPPGDDDDGAGDG